MANLSVRLLCKRTGCLPCAEICSSKHFDQGIQRLRSNQPAESRWPGPGSLGSEHYFGIKRLIEAVCVRVCVVKTKKSLVPGLDINLPA